MHVEYSERAKKARSRGDAGAAGDCFTAAAYTLLGSKPPWENVHSLFRAERALLEATLCYRLGGHHERAINRHQQGVLFGEDIIARFEGSEETLDQLHMGTAAEYIGDLRIVGTDATDAAEYDFAIDWYQSAMDAPLVNFEESNDYAIAFFNELVLRSGADIDTVDVMSKERTLTEWIEYKRTHLPSLRDQILAAGLEAYSDPL